MTAQTTAIAVVGLVVVGLTLLVWVQRPVVDVRREREEPERW